MKAAPPILVTGATGYVGGRLLKALRARGHRVRCMARHPGHLEGRVDSGVEIVRGDVTDPATLPAALEGIDTAYYLIHSMGSAEGFEELDRGAARNFALAARDAGVHRIVYLGGLGERKEGLSPHLESRQEVGRILREHSGATEVVEFRASIIIGAGSASFEMIRALVERLPAMVTPRWVSVRAQPIAIRDVVQYLVEGFEYSGLLGGVYEVGGRDTLSYRELMLEYARQRGLRRVMIPLPVLTPRLSSLWLGLVTPLYARVGRRLIDSMRHPTLVHDREALERFSVVPMSTAEAIAEALRDEDEELADTSWHSAMSAAGSPKQWGGVRFGNRLVDSRSRVVQVPRDRAFQPIARIGGRTGWYAWNLLWRIRGWMDLLLGGVGMRRGRRDPERLAVGDVVDCWRVEAWEVPSRLLLAAEMKLPGRAWLEFEVSVEGPGSRIRQTAVFDPVGLPGLLYWYAIWPLHRLVFVGMLRGVARAARQGA